MRTSGIEIEFGRYLLTRKLAHGGMAEVFLGRPIGSPADSPPLVIKRILPELMLDERYVAMFVNEAQLAAQMDHPNLVKVLDFGEVNGRLFMIMEYVDGLDCWRFSRRMHPWGEHHEALAVHIMREILAGLSHAHELRDVNDRPMNVVHRDLSPSNIYLSLEGEAKLGDFGIARIDSPRYRPIEVIPKGKFGYMPPEQVESGEVDARGDVYSAGVVLGELLIGQKIFSGPSQLSIMLDIQDGRFDVLDDNADRIPPELMRVIRIAVARDPERRYGSAAELRQALGEHLESAGLSPSSQLLGEHVRRAMDLGDPRSSTSGLRRAPSTPLTGDLAPGFPDPRSEPDPLEALREHTPSDQGGTPVTSDYATDPGENRFVAHLEDGRVVGPTSYAHVIELIYSDVVGPETLISIGGRPLVPAAELPDLSRHLPAHTPTREVDEVDAPDRRGILEIEPVAEALLTLATKGETGLLVAQRGERRKEVYFREGSVIYVSSNDSSELLGEFMVRGGIIDRMELEMALALLPKFNGHLGDALVALGMISAVELFNAIRNQLCSRLIGLLGWSSGSYDFYRGVACRPGVLEVPMDVFALVRETAVESAEKIDPPAVLAAMSETGVAPSSRRDELLEGLDPPGAIKEVIASLQGWEKIEDLARRSPAAEGTLARAIHIALQCGLWTFDGPAPPWRDERQEESTAGGAP